MKPILLLQKYFSEVNVLLQNKTASIYTIKYVGELNEKHSTKAEYVIWSPLFLVLNIIQHV